MHKVQQRGDAEGDVDGDDDEPHSGFHVALRKAQQSDGEGSLGPGEGGDGEHGADGDREGELGEVLQREVPDVATVAERDDVGGDAHVDEQADERGDQDAIVPPELAGEEGFAVHARGEEGGREEGEDPDDGGERGAESVVGKEGDLLWCENRPAGVCHGAGIGSRSVGEIEKATRKKKERKAEWRFAKGR